MRIIPESGSILGQKKKKKRIGAPEYLLTLPDQTRSLRVRSRRRVNFATIYYLWPFFPCSLLITHTLSSFHVDQGRAYSRTLVLFLIENLSNASVLPSFTTRPLLLRTCIRPVDGRFLPRRKDCEGKPSPKCTWPSTCKAARVPACGMLSILALLINQTQTILTYSSAYSLQARLK